MIFLKKQIEGEKELLLQKKKCFRTIWSEIPVPGGSSNPNMPMRSSLMLCDKPMSLYSKKDVGQRKNEKKKKSLVQ